MTRHKNIATYRKHMNTMLKKELKNDLKIILLT